VTDAYDAEFGKDGSLRLGKELERFFAAHAGTWRLVAGSKGLVAFGRAERASASGLRVLMTGEILSRTTLLEVLSAIANAGWRGDLRVFSGGVERGLHIDQGTVKHAHSSHHDDRLGEVMFRLGAIDREQMAEVLAAITPTRRFGAVMLEKGLVTREQLFSYLQKQVEEIFFSTVLIGSGTYAFTSPDEASPPPPATVHLSVQSLLMEGVQRIDEMALFRERIPNGKLVPDKKSSERPQKLDEAGRTLFDRIDGQKSVLELARDLGMSEFEATKALYNLLSTGAVVLHSGARVGTAGDEVERLLGEFGPIFAEIFGALKKHNAAATTLATIRTWLSGSAHAQLLGEALTQEGALDHAKVKTALAAVKADHPLEQLHQALVQLSGFALFTATTALPRDEEMALSRSVNQRLTAIRAH
jgi:hypothetical protein